MSVELKIKSKHLAEEAKIIRFEEHKLKRQIDWMEARQQGETAKLRDSWMSIKNHRRLDVRNENRATFLARAFIAGKPYKAIEAKVHDIGTLNQLVSTRVTEMVAKYGRAMRRRWNTEKKAYLFDQEEYNDLKKSLLAWIAA